ncbi:hypothetical protein BC940DRAFT_306948 [Gongronella butleri]|nr:hypothetical protein BC940DRAFT_306948 [Gongronella butleri]
MASHDLPEDLFLKFMEQGIAKGLLPECVPTIQRDAYLSRSYIERACARTLQQEGRASIAQLAQTLHIQPDALLPMVPDFERKNNWTLVGDTLLTRVYQEDLKRTTLKQLDTDGYITLLHVTSQASLPHRFIQELFQDLASTHACYDELPDMYFCKRYTEDLEKQIWDALSAVTTPLTMSTWIKTLDAQQDLVYVLLSQMTKRPDLPGVLRGRRERAIYIPNTFRDHQLAMIDSLLQASNYIEYDTVQHHYAWTAPRELLQKRHADLVLLTSCAVTPALIQALEDALMQLDTWVETRSLLPSAIAAPDVLTLVDAALQRVNKAAKKGTLVSFGQHVASTSFLQSIVDAAQPFIVQCAQTELANEKRTHSAKPKKGQGIDAKFSAQEIQVYIEQQHQLPSVLAEQVAAKIKRPMNDRLADAVKSIYVQTPLADVSNQEKSTNKWVQQQAAHLLSLLTKQRRTLIYDHKALALLDDASVRKSMEKYMVRQLGVDFLFYLVLLVTSWHAADQAELLNLTGLRSVDVERPDKVADVQKKEVIAALVCSETTYKEPLARLLDAMTTGKKLGEFQAYLYADTSNSNPLIERLGWSAPTESDLTEAREELIRTLQQQLTSTTASAATAPLILHLTTLALFQDVYAMPLNVSGKFVPAVLKQLSSRLDAAMVELLSSTQDAILAQQKEKTTTAAIDTELVKQVRQIGIETCKKQQ